jgi:hypothetical protein
VFFLGHRRNLLRKKARPAGRRAIFTMRIYIVCEEFNELVMLSWIQLIAACST